MSFTIGQIKEHLTGMGHGGTLNKVRNIEAMFERSISKFLLKAKPIETIRTTPLASAVHDRVYDYALPSDFNVLIDLFPQANRTSWDYAYRAPNGQFNLNKAIEDKVVAIDGNNGSKIIRINWAKRAPQVLHTMDSVTANGTWSAVGSATGIVADSITKYSGRASIKFNLVASGGGIQNTTMDSVDLTDADEVADIFVPVYLGSDYANATSVTLTWGNNLTTAYWTSVAQTTQADGTAFQRGWNLVKFPWSSATETGTVDPATIDSAKITLATTSALDNVRVDNILVSIGTDFDIKYYSKYIIQNTSGTLVSRTGSDDDLVLIDNDTLPVFLFECLKDMAHQMEGTDSAFDINYAEKELAMLYPMYRAINPSNAKKVAGRYASSPARKRW